MFINAFRARKRFLPIWKKPPLIWYQADEAYALAAGLEQAPLHGGLALQYQPVIDSRRGKRTGAEALLRLACQDSEPISPTRFIPAAEFAGLIGKPGE